MEILYEKVSFKKNWIKRKSELTNSFVCLFHLFQEDKFHLFYLLLFTLTLKCNLLKKKKKGEKNNNFFFSLFSKRVKVNLQMKNCTCNSFFNSFFNLLSLLLLPDLLVMLRSKNHFCILVRLFLHRHHHHHICYLNHFY